MSNNFRTIATFLFFICSAAVVAVMFVLIVKEKRRAHAIEDEIRTLQEEKERYEHENVELQDRIAYLKSDRSYEKEAKKLNYKKPGEHVVIVRRSPESGDDTVVNDEEREEEQKEHYEVWISYFF